MAQIKAGVKVVMIFGIVEKITGKVIMPHIKFEHIVQPEQFCYEHDMILEIRSICLVKMKFVQELYLQMKESPGLAEKIAKYDWRIDDVLISKEILH